MTQLKERRRLIDSFVNSVTIFDNCILVTFNYKEGSAQGRGKNRTQRIVIHYNFIGVLDLPEVEEYPENVVLDSRQGVAIEYLVGKAG
mgnify:CR=1 FL=1